MSVLVSRRAPSDSSPTGAIWLVLREANDGSWCSSAPIDVTTSQRRPVEIIDVPKTPIPAGSDPRRMAQIQVHEEVSLDDPIVVEGLPGVGLVGKIAADHLVESFDTTHHASLHCEGLPEVAVYHEGTGEVRAPVRIYADEARDLLVLQSDVPVSPSGAEGFAGCLTGWLDERGATPLCCSGRPVDAEGEPDCWGVATGAGQSILDRADLSSPDHSGAVSGPTGAILHEAERRSLPAVGAVLAADPQFPDPAAAQVYLTEAVEPIAGVEVDTDSLVERAEEVSEAKAELARRMQEAGDESSQARPLGMYQ